MPEYSKSSKTKLATCHTEIRIVFNEVIKRLDYKILYGYRLKEEQFELFKIGRKQDENGIWYIENELIKVTNCDGYEIVSNHNVEPSNAVDAMPYPIDWRDMATVCYYAGQVKEIARALGIELIWGRDWDDDKDLKDQSFNDYAHWERKKI